MARRVYSRLVLRLVLSTCVAGRRRSVARRRHRRRLFVVVRHLALLVLFVAPWLPARSSPRSCFACPVRASRAGFLPLPRRVCLLSVLPLVVVSLVSPLVRQVGRGEYGLRLGLGSPRVACCLLLAAAGPWDVAGRFLSWVLLFAAVSMASAGGCGFRRASLLAVGLSIGLAYLARVVPVACLPSSSSCRHGLIVIGCRRRGSGSSSVVVVRRRLACPRGGASSSALPRGRFRLPSSRLVVRAVARLVVPSAPPVLSWGGAVGGALVLVPCGSLLVVSLRRVFLFLRRRLVAGRGGLARFALVRGRVRHRSRCPVACSAAGVAAGGSCFRVVLPRYAFRPVPLVEERGDFSSLVGFPFFC